ncbi:MAG: hypothetical protein ACREJQ_05840 [bacterium]
MKTAGVSVITALFLLASGISPLWPDEVQAALKRPVHVNYSNKSVGAILDDLARQIGGSVEFDSSAFEAGTSSKITLLIPGDLPAHQAFTAVGGLRGLAWDAGLKPVKKASPKFVIRFFLPAPTEFPKTLLDREYALETDAPMPLVDTVTKLASDVGIGVAFAPDTFDALKDMVVTLSIPRTPLRDLLKLLEVRTGVSAEIIPLGNQFVLMISR